MVAEPVDATRLGTPLHLIPPTDHKVEGELVEKILDALYSAKNPMILADVLTARFHCTPQVRQLVDITQLPVSLTCSKLIRVIHDKFRKGNLTGNTSYLYRDL
jgi:TPP-dependent 2-oxoacid decarboxylase